MTIKTKTNNGTFIELIIESGNAKITEDVAIYKKGVWCVSEQEIEQLITAANDMSRFNGTSDVQFVKNIYDSFLTDGERSEFLELINPHTH